MDTKLDKNINDLLIDTMSCCEHPVFVNQRASANVTATDAYSNRNHPLNTSSKNEIVLN